MTYPSISYRIADELKELTGQEIRVTIPGHYQRGALNSFLLIFASS